MKTEKEIVAERWEQMKREHNIRPLKMNWFEKALIYFVAFLDYLFFAAISVWIYKKKILGISAAIVFVSAAILWLVLVVVSCLP